MIRSIKKQGKIYYYLIKFIIIMDYRQICTLSLKIKYNLLNLNSIIIKIFTLRSIEIILNNGVKIVIDNKSKEILNNSILKYKKSLLSNTLYIENPNVVSLCGCGESFSIKERQ